LNELERQELAEALQELNEALLDLRNLLWNKYTLIFVIVVVFCIFFFSYKRLYRKHKIKQSRKAAKINMKDWVKWYRELPATYSPAIVSVLYDYQQELHKDLAGVILYLCVNDYIDIVDNGNDVLFYDKNKDESSLMYHEKYVLNYILNKIDVFDNKKYQEYVSHDAQELGLIIDKKSSKYKGMGGMAIWGRLFENVEKYAVILMPVIGFLGGFFRGYLLFKPLTSISEYIASIGIGLLGVMVAMFVYVLVVRIILVLFLIRPAAKEKVKSEFDYQRTEKGNFDYKNWRAFKQFLDDFSIIDERDFNEIYLWEYYLAYATSLGSADQVLKTADARIINNKKFKILNYNKFIANIDKRKSG